MKNKYIKYGATLMMLGMFSAHSSQDNPFIPSGMHNYTEQAVAFYGLNGNEYNHNTSTTFKGAQMRWGDFNDDGLEDVVLLSGDSHEYFSLRNNYDKDICLDVNTGDNHVNNYVCHGGKNQRWRYDEVKGHLISALDSSKCLRHNHENLLLGSCANSNHSRFYFFDDGTIRTKNTHVELEKINDMAINGYALQSEARVGLYHFKGRSANKQWRKDFGNMKVKVFLNKGERNGKIEFRQVRELEGLLELPFFGDFDGDGKDELLVDTWPTRELRTSDHALPQVKVVALASKTGQKAYGVGDFNADGKDDILYPHYGDLPNQLVIFLNDSESITDNSSLHGHYYPLANSIGVQREHRTTNVVVGDFDSRYGADIIIQNMSYEQDDAGAFLLLNKGRGNDFDFSSNYTATFDSWPYHFHRRSVSGQGDIKNLQVGKLDGKDTIFIQNGGIEGFQLHHVDENNIAQFTRRVLKTSHVTPNDDRHEFMPHAGIEWTKLSFGDINGDGQSDVIRSEHGVPANDSGNTLNALIHTKWNEDISLTYAGWLLSGTSIYTNNRPGTQSFSSGYFGTVNYYIFYDESGNLSYRLRQAGVDGWSVKQSLPLYNKTPVNASPIMGLKSLVIGDYLYTLRFGEDNKVFVDRWNIDRRNNSIGLVPTKIFQGYQWVVEQTAYLDLDTYYSQAVSKLAVYVLKPGHLDSYRLHFMHPTSANELVNRTVLLESAGAVPNSFEETITLGNIVGDQFLDAMVTTHKGVVELSDNAQLVTGNSTAVVDTSVHVAIVMGDSANKAVAFIPVSVNGKLKPLEYIDYDNYINLGHAGNRYLGILPDEHNPLGVNIILEEQGGIKAIKPNNNGTSETVIINALKLGKSNQTITGFDSSTYISTNQFCNQAILVFNNTPHAFNINCRSVKLQRYGNDISIDTIVGIIEGPPPFPAENLVQSSSSFVNYTKVVLEEEGSNELKLVTKAGIGQQQQASTKVLAAGFGVYGNFEAQSEYVQGYENIFATSEEITTSHDPVTQDCDEYEYNLALPDGSDTEEFKDFFYRMKASEDSGYFPTCYLNSGVLVVRGTQINIFAIVDKQDGVVYGLIPIPTKNRVTTLRDFIMDRDYVRVGSLDGKIGPLELAGRKKFGDNSDNTSTYPASFSSYEGLAIDLESLDTKIKSKVNQQRALIGGQFGINSALALASGTAFGLGSSSLGIGGGGILSSIVSLAGVPQTAEYSFSRTSEATSSQTLSISDQESFAFNGSGSVIAGFAEEREVSVNLFNIIEIESVNTQSNIGAGLNWHMETELSTADTTSRHIHIEQNAKPFRGIEYANEVAKDGSKCLGLVASYDATAYFIPASADNYRHFLTNVLDTQYNDSLELPVKATPWRISYGVTNVVRLPSPSIDTCKGL
jgi:hypothetical protein